MTFGLTMEKILLIGLIAVMIIGPERLPAAAESLRRTIQQVRRMARTAQERVREELGPEVADVDWQRLDPRRYDPRRIIREALLAEPDAVAPAAPPAPTAEEAAIEAVEPAVPAPSARASESAASASAPTVPRPDPPAPLEAASELDDDEPAWEAAPARLRPSASVDLRAPLSPVVDASSR